VFCSDGGEQFEQYRAAAIDERSHHAASDRDYDDQYVSSGYSMTDGPDNHFTWVHSAKLNLN